MQTISSSRFQYLSSEELDTIRVSLDAAWDRVIRHSNEAKIGRIIRVDDIIEIRGASCPHWLIKSKAAHHNGIKYTITCMCDRYKPSFIERLLDMFNPHTLHLTICCDGYGNIHTQFMEGEHIVSIDLHDITVIGR